MVEDGLSTLELADADSVCKMVWESIAVVVNSSGELD